MTVSPPHAAAGFGWAPAERAVIGQVLASPASLILGAAGTGKTSLALEIARQAQAQSGWRADDVVLIGASRRTATKLRDQLTASVDQVRTQPSARTMPSLAFSILAARAAAEGQPPPTLISGPEQDTILAELLAGHVEGEGVTLPWPADLPPEVLELRGFRAELRDLFMRTAEHGLTATDLAQLASTHHRPEWALAGALYGEYLDNLTLQQSTADRGARFDPAVIIDEAADVLQDWLPDADPRPHWRMLIVDDYQEATAATARLLHALQEQGTQLVLLAEPDLAVQTHRGANPALTGQAKAPAGTALGAYGAQIHTLTTNHRYGPALHQAIQRITAGLPAHADPTRRRHTPAPHAPQTTVQTTALASPAQEVAHISHLLRTQHLLNEVPWEKMAVITRSGAQLEQLRRGLSHAQVPVSMLGSDLPLHTEPAVRPLLDLLVLVTTKAPASQRVDLSIEAALDLLYSPLFELDSLGLRRLRRALRRNELSLGQQRTSDQILLDHLTGRQEIELTKPAGYLQSPLRAARRLAATIKAGLAAATQPGTDATQILWHLWDSTGCAERWRKRALADAPASGLAADRANQDLDAVLALMRAVEQFTERLPQAPALAFVEYLRSQDLPADTLAAQGTATGTVSLLTAAGAAGGEWDVVVVAGVQDGVWPDLRLRDSLLGAGDLSDLAANRSSSNNAITARQEVFDDERRAFHVAISRARNHLEVTAVRNEDDQPSVFFDTLAPDDAPQNTQSAPLPLDLRGLASALRGALQQPDLPDAAASDPEVAARAAARRDAAVLLTWLAQTVPAAAPENWYGTQAWSTLHSIASEGPVRLSPSQLEQIETCPLRWFLERHGGTNGERQEQNLGTMIHQLAQEFPSGGLSQMLERFDELLPALQLPDNWAGRQQLERARHMVTRLHTYLAHEAGKPLAQEVSFELATEEFLLRGNIDRLEEPTSPEPALRVVDFKTGSSPVTKAAAEIHPQLGAYQYALQRGALPEFTEGREIQGAALVYLGDQSAATGGTERHQPPLTEDSWMSELLAHATHTMRASQFTAQTNPACTHCPVRTSCPMQPEGQQVQTP